LNEHSEDAEAKTKQEQTEQNVRQGTSPLQVAQSVAAALIGVQSSRNRHRDFSTGKPLHFVVGGIIGTLLFITLVWLLVQYVLATS